MEEIEQLENGKLMFHSYEALKKYCDDVDNPLDKVVLGEEITALNSEDEENGGIKGLFEYSIRTNKQFKGIADWDVSKVINMHGMFYVMYGMFKGAEKFNQPLEKWDVSKVKDMSCMFDGAKSFNQPIGNWDVSKVSNMYGMFKGAEKFNQPLDNWNLSNKPYGAEALEQFIQTGLSRKRVKRSFKKFFHR